MFTSLQQKDISGFLTYLWQTDPFKAKWSILAKAYSRIRDSKGKAKAPLDSYLAINGPLIGIVPPEKYLEMLGWKIVAGDDGGRLLRRDFDVDVSSLDQDLLTSNVSVNDIIKHSYASGYIEADDVNLIMPDNEPAMTMATLMQHKLPVKSANSAPANNGTSGASGPATAVNMTNANDAIESSGVEDDNAILLADREATDDTSFLNDMDSDMVTSMGISGIAVTEAVVDDFEVVANTQTGWDPQDILSTWEALAEPVVVSNDTPLVPSDSTPLVANTGRTWYSAAASIPNPYAGDFVRDNAFAFTDFGQYPFDNHFTPDDPDFEFDPYMGDPFNSYDMTEYFDFSKFPFED